MNSSKSRNCRHCEAPLEVTFCDLGMSPLANSYVPAAHSDRMEPFFPLHAYVCGECFLVQLEEFETPENIFTEYAYFSSVSKSWVDHAERYVKSIIPRLDLDESNQVIEIASNDGYLLQFFQKAKVPVLGIEPAANVAKAATARGIPTRVEFFGSDLAETLRAEGIQADLLLGNNVLAHVPRLNDFVKGMQIVLSPGGVITMEFPHLLRLIEESQFDTIYHEHFSYLSLITVERVFAKFGLRIFDVEELSTHGGSLRIYATHSENIEQPTQESVNSLKIQEKEAGLADLKTYTDFSSKVTSTKRSLLKFLVEAKTNGKTVVGYGAPAKGNTLLNYCGVRTDFIDYTVDRSPQKQGHLLPGVRIPIHSPDVLSKTKPDYVLILPWNLKEEILEQIDFVRDWGGKFVIPIPEVEVVS